MNGIVDLIESGKIKRFFRGKKKISFQGAITHVTQHATGKEFLFLEEKDYLYMLYLVKKISNIFNFNVLSFALMLNHIHLLIRLGNDNLAVAMQNLFQIYAEYFNKKYYRKGHVFCGPYRSALCFDDNYLLAASCYIHINPVKAKLVENPIDYRWSSCALFLKENIKNTFINYKFILDILDDDISIARLKYNKLLEYFKVRKIRNVLEHPNGLDFMVTMLRKEWLQEHGLSGDGDIDVKIEELRNKGRLRSAEDIRARKAVIEYMRSRGYSVTEIADRFNLTRKALYKTLKYTKQAWPKVCT
jgi:putative transposase